MKTLYGEKKLAIQDVLRLLPPEWQAGQPLVFEGLRSGYIARISGDYPILGSVLIARSYELEGIGPTPVAALQALTEKLTVTSHNNSRRPE